MTIDHRKIGKAAKVKGAKGEKLTSDIVEKFDFADWRYNRKLWIGVEKEHILL